MDLHLTGGTPRQQRWVQDALVQCSYPLDKLNATVTVVWGPPPANVDTRHPMMVTEVVGDGRYQITIEPWADDPKSPNNQGLPDPDGDIYEFYKQTFIHEIGHVATYATFDPGSLDTDPRIAQMCALFWRPEVNSGSGRRYGALADWDSAPLVWADEIRETVAEVFKCAFYRGRLVFTNRTNWRIDPSAWSDFLAFFTLHAGVHGSASASASLKVVRVASDPGNFFDPATGTVHLFLDLQGVGEAPHMTVIGTYGSGTGVTVVVGVLDNGADVVAEVTELEPPFWLHLSVDLSDPAHPKAVGKVTSDAAGNTVIWSYTWPFDPFPATSLPNALFASRVYLADPTPDHDNPTTIADWRFSASQSAPNFVNEQFAKAADISLYDPLINTFFNGSFSTPVTGPAVWDGTLHFLPYTGTTSFGSSVIELQSFFPTGQDAIAPSAPYPFGGPGAVAPGASAHGLIRIGNPA